MTATTRSHHRARADDAPERRCVASGRLAARGTLIRFVRAPDGGIVPDLAARLPGRGVWVAARAEAVERAARRGLMARGLGDGPTPAPDLSDRVAVLLARRALEALGLARRAGAVAVGFEAVRAMARAGDIGLVLAATDGAAGGRAKLARLVGAAPVYTLFGAAEQGAAVGREHAVQIAVNAGGPAQRLATDLDRLAGYHALGDDDRLRRELGTNE